MVLYLIPSSKVDITQFMHLSHKKTQTQLHFVGIGGIGMSGIAEVFLNQGYPVSGSDTYETETTQKLTQMGAKISKGHHADNIRDSSVVIISSAIEPTNPEVIEAKKLRIPVIPRAEMLGELMRGKTGIAVAGSHGKTTTTSMLATVLVEVGLDPTLIIGGKVDSFGGNAKLGQGDLVVAEADESDGSFLHLPATYGIITNIDNDHLDHFGSLAHIEDAFVEFVGQFPFYGLVATCAEDPGVARSLERMTKPTVTYGFGEQWDYSASDLELKPLGSSFRVRQRGKLLGPATLHVPGRHNILNALATLAISQRLEIPFEQWAQALEKFIGVKRRFEICWQDLSQKKAIIDDYGHHPTEIYATLESARRYWKDRIVTIFQPHRYTRTHFCHDEFLSAFKHTDVLLISDIYPAGEVPIEGVSSENLVKDLQRTALSHQKIIYSGTLEETKQKVLEFFQEGDLLLCLGAGSIGRLTEQLIKELS